MNEDTILRGDKTIRIGDTYKSGNETHKYLGNGKATRVK